ncbi:MAG: hypothetical protein U0235_18220 [Polyangiaceae bacterium]
MSILRATLAIALAGALAGAAQVACGKSEDDASATGTTDASTAGDGAAEDADRRDDVVLGPPVDAALPRPPSRIWAHTASELYRFDPEAKTLTRVGAFTGLDTTPLDLAEARDGGLYVSTYTGLFRVDPATAAATRLSPDSGVVTFLNSLAFVPAGTLDPNDETLVGYVQGDGGLVDRYVRVDRVTGALTPVGSLNAPDAAVTYTLSGDLVSLARDHGRTFIAASQSSPPRAPDAGFDQVVEVDPVSGRAMGVVGNFSEPYIWGLGYWNGTFYGFAMSGNVVAVPSPAPDASVASLSALDGGMWFGAGVTNDAPLSP